MGTSAASTWRKTRRNNTPGRAGEFYELLIAETLGCELSELGQPEYADMFSLDLGIRVEVKSRGENNGIGIHVKQKREYQEAPPFPLTYTLYALVPYKSRKRIKAGEKRPRGFSKKTTMFSVLKLLKTKAQQQEHWSSSVEIVYLLDLKVIDALEKLLGTKRGHFAGREDEEAIVIGRTKLKELFRNGSFATAMRKLRLKPTAFAKGVYPTRIRMVINGKLFNSEFTLITVLPKRLNAEVAKILAAKALTLV